MTANSGGVYVSGQTNGALPGQIAFGLADVWVRKYDLNGNEIWTRQFGTASSESPNAIFIDGSGVYVGGSTHGVIDDPTTPQTNSGLADSFVRKYSLNGDHLWSRTFGLGRRGGRNRNLSQRRDPGRAGWPNERGLDAFVVKLERRWRHAPLRLG